MMKIKRLFWKIFAAFWLVSLAIMIVTSYAILASVESEKFREQYERALKEFSERALNHYEALPEDRPLRKSLLRKLGPPHNFVSHRQIVGITRDDKIVFARNDKRFDADDTFKFKVTTDKGNRYSIEALKPRPPRHLLNLLQRVNTLQFFLILFASTLVSFFLSWSITRPLKALGVASRQFAQGELHTGIDAELLKRSDELGQLAQDVAYMMRQTQQTISAQKQLLHDVSHELRAPLARLQVAAELIQQREEKQSSYIQRIHAECERMDQLIQRILNFARLEEAATHFSPIELGKLIQKHLENIRFEHPDRPIHFLAPAQEMLIRGDASLLGEALDNVLRNACKYTPEGSPIDIEVNPSPRLLVIAIRDHGPGVPAADLEKLTTPFYRSGNRMHGDGFGLGLSIARRAIEKHGGQLRLENVDDGGLRVSLELPQFGKH